MILVLAQYPSAFFIFTALQHLSGDASLVVLNLTWVTAFWFTLIHAQRLGSLGSALRQKRPSRLGCRPLHL